MFVEYFFFLDIVYLFLPLFLAQLFVRSLSFMQGLGPTLPHGNNSTPTSKWEQKTKIRLSKSKWSSIKPGSLGLEKGMAPHSSTLAWKIPWMEEPGGLQSMGSLGVRHDWATWLSLFTFMHWRRKWQPTPVFLRGESQGRGSLVGCHLWGHTELDTTEAT